MSVRHPIRDVVATGLHVPEGPAMLPDGSLVFTEQTAGRISRLTPDGVEPYAVTGGAPNSCVVGATGELYVCQNGGKVGSWLSPEPRTPGIYAVSPDGANVDLLTATVAGRRLDAPNDLIFAPDGRLFFTDPAQPFDPVAPVDAGSLYILGASRALDSVAFDVGGVYCNGLAFGTAGELIWVESYTRRVRSLANGSTPVTLATLPVGHVPDGMAVAVDGRIFIASCGAHRIDVLHPDGRLLDSIYLDDNANPTNCCFDGTDLLITDFGMDFAAEDGAGRIWRVETDTTGIHIHRGSISHFLA